VARSNISDSADSYLNGLSSVKSNLSVLYTALADRVTMPSVKVMLSGLAAVCQTNSVILKGFGKDVEEQSVKSKERDEDVSEVIDTTYDAYKKIIEKEEIAVAELQSLAGQLVVLEGILGEKYKSVQSKTSKLVMRESVKLVHGLDLDKLGLMFDKIMCAVEVRRKVLGSVKTLAEEKTRKEKNSSIPEGFIVFSPTLEQVATLHCGK
jgi:hypothetical protein